MVSQIILLELKQTGKSRENNSCLISQEQLACRIIQQAKPNLIENSLPNNSVSSQEQLAKQIGLSVDTLQNYKKLNDLIPELQFLVETNQLKATVAYKIWAKMPQEAEIWEEIERIKARDRMLATQNNNSAKGSSASVSWIQQGKTHDIVAEKVGIASGSTYKRARVVVKTIDKWNFPFSKFIE